MERGGDGCPIEFVRAAEYPSDFGQDDAREPGTWASRYASQHQLGSLVLLLVIAHEQAHDYVRIKRFHDRLRLRRSRDPYPAS